MQTIKPFISSITTLMHKFMKSVFIALIKLSMSPSICGFSCFWLIICSQCFYGLQENSLKKFTTLNRNLSFHVSHILSFTLAQISPSAIWEMWLHLSRHETVQPNSTAVQREVAPEVPWQNGRNLNAAQSFWITCAKRIQLTFCTSRWHSVTSHTNMKAT